MRRIEGIPFVKLKNMECDAKKKRFEYLKTPLKGLYYVPSDVEKKSRTLNVERFVPALLDALQKERGFRLHYGIVTSARNCGLSWRPTRFIEVFNNKKTFEADFGLFAEKYGKLRSYYSKTISHFYSSLPVKRILFRKVVLMPPNCIAYDDRYLIGFYITKKCILEKAKRYAPKNAKKYSFLKSEYASLFSDMKKIG